VTDVAAMAFDVDGTLLNSKVRMTDGTYEALLACHRQGIVLYIATARPRHTVFRTCEIDRDMSFINDKGVFLCGALVVDDPLGYRREYAMAADIVSAIVDETVGMDGRIQICIQQFHGGHAFRYPIPEPELCDWGLTARHILPFERAGRQPSAKMLLYSPGDLGEGYQWLGRLIGERVSAFLTDDRHWIQITAPRARKETALLELLALRGIDPAHVAAFGDNTADVGMLKACGLSVAMGNSPPAVKEAARFVTGSNDDDGVGAAIRERFGVSVD